MNERCFFGNITFYKDRIFFLPKNAYCFAVEILMRFDVSNWWNWGKEKRIRDKFESLFWRERKSNKEIHLCKFHISTQSENFRLSYSHTTHIERKLPKIIIRYVSLPSFPHLFPLSLTVMDRKNLKNRTLILFFIYFR